MTSTRSTLPAISAGTLADTPQPVLADAGGLLLRPWEATDAAVFFAAYRDPEIQRWHTRQPVSEDQVREWFDRYRQDWVREKGAHWAVTGSGGEVLGRIATGGIDLDDGVAGCAYWVLPAARGAGVASRALTALSVWALGETWFPPPGVGSLDPQPGLLPRRHQVWVPSGGHQAERRHPLRRPARHAPARPHPSISGLTQFVRNCQECATVTCRRLVALPTCALWVTLPI